MMMKKMLKPGIRVKRYIFLALASIITMAVAIAKLIDERHLTTIHDKAVFIILIIFSGLVGYKSIVWCVKSVVSLVNKGYINLSIEEQERVLFSEELVACLWEKHVVTKEKELKTVSFLYY